MKEPISITSLASISSLGFGLDEIWSQYLNEDHFLRKIPINNSLEYVAELPKTIKEKISLLRESDTKYSKLDDSVLYAILVSREAVKKANWRDGVFGVNIGSSRGATQLFEKYHAEYLQKGKSATLTSPTTTLGNISSWVAHDLKANGPEISHSITCSTALHAVINGIAWLQAGFMDKFLVGGCEAALTDFTIAQMKALKIYTTLEEEYPCRALDLEKNKNTMVLGEGASVACLEVGNKKNALAKIIGFGYATETLVHNISISTEADCFQKSMRMAIGNRKSEEIDAIVMHAPGTIKGDISEFKAIKKVFGENLPFLTSNKWKLGHTFGASGMLSLELAVLMLLKQKTIPVPYVDNQDAPKKLQNILVNAVGFGGNAVSILLSK